MSMKVHTRQVDGVTILDLSGRITLGEGSVTIRDAVRDVLGKGSNKILLNLGDITYIDSSGIGELVSAFTTVKAEAAEPDQEGPRPAADHETVHRLRRQGRRSNRNLFVHQVKASGLTRYALAIKSRRCCDGFLLDRSSVRFAISRSRPSAPLSIRVRRCSTRSWDGTQHSLPRRCSGTAE